MSRDCEVHIVPRADNANGARAKVHATSTIPVSPALVRLYSQYMHVEYGLLDSDYVFVNLWGQPLGHPLTYRGVDRIVQLVRRRSGVVFTPHMLRHSRASELIRAGVPLEIVSKLLTHASVTTTSRTYVHLDAQDIRRELERAGAWRPIAAEPAAPVSPVTVTHSGASR